MHQEDSKQHAFIEIGSRHSSLWSCLFLVVDLFLCSFQQQQQMYIAQVLQDPNLDEPGGGSSEEDRGSSQDEEMLNGGNSINEADFQSGEDSLIANEVHQ